VVRDGESKSYGELSFEISLLSSFQTPKSHDFVYFEFNKVEVLRVISILFQVSTNNRVGFFINLFLFTNVYYRLIYDTAAHYDSDGKLMTANLAQTTRTSFELPEVCSFSFTNIYLYIISSFATPRHATME
jgi:hypothetical protein